MAAEKKVKGITETHSAGSGDWMVEADADYANLGIPTALVFSLEHPEEYQDDIDGGPARIMISRDEILAALNSIGILPAP